jgi:hypothetical protein
MALSLPASRDASLKRENTKQSAWPDWKNQTCVLMASGPSLTAADVDLVKNYRMHGAMTLRTIAINDCGLARRLPLAAPWADILYAADQKWWRFYQPAFTDLRVSGEKVDGVETQPLTMLARGEPMPRIPGSVVSGDHSGFQALGLALSLGVSRIWLLGYDCGGKRRNCHTGREPQFATRPPFENWIKKYKQAADEWPKVEIVNCSADSAITVFQKRPLSEVI